MIEQRIMCAAPRGSGRSASTDRIVEAHQVAVTEADRNPLLRESSATTSSTSPSRVNAGRPLNRPRTSRCRSDSGRPVSPELIRSMGARGSRSKDEHQARRALVREHAHVLEARHLVEAVRDATVRLDRELLTGLDVHEREQRRRRVRPAFDLEFHGADWLPEQPVKRILRILRSRRRGRHDDGAKRECADQAGTCVHLKTCLMRKSRA